MREVTMRFNVKLFAALLAKKEENHLKKLFINDILFHILY